ncbi:T9SS type A sorting domain-containing protein [candidate division KSB1 bacterium]|nr:T9SS type A sorting domain-containing protein [candidate division KSB1 bacterium]
MNLKQITLIGLVFLLFFCAAQIHVIFAGETTQYQLYRLSDDLSDDRRPKLAINDQGIVWVDWESNRDGDFDIYGKQYANGTWSNLIGIETDSIETFLCSAFFDSTQNYHLLVTKVDMQDEASTYFFKHSKLFLLSFVNDSLRQKKFIAHVHHDQPTFSNDMPQIVYFGKNKIICYHRESLRNTPTWTDSLFLKHLQGDQWQNEQCDSIFEEYNYSILREQYYFFPFFSINLVDWSIFFIGGLKFGHTGIVGIDDIGLFIDHNLNKNYTFLSQYYESYYSETRGFLTGTYGANKNHLYFAGYFTKSVYSNERESFIGRLNFNVMGIKEIQNQWYMSFEANIKISQMSNLVAFIWSDSANIYIKTLQDSTWYETLEIPVNGLTHIDQSLNCAVFNNQQIWITFDAIYNGNKDVYAVSVPASFVVDTVMTSVEQSRENKTTPGEFALFQNYPNPFNSSTEIKYSLPQEKSSYHVALKIYDIRGRLVSTLVEQNQAGGMYSVNWDGKDKNGQFVSSGMYFYTLQADKYKTTNKMLLIH